MRLLPVLATLLLTLTSGCRAGSSSALPVPDLTTEVGPRVARVNVMRRSQARGAMHLLRVFDGDEEVGAFGQGQFLCWERRPGRALIRVVYEGPALDRANTEALFDLQVEPGQAYYLGIEIEADRNLPHIVALKEQEARERLQGLKVP